MIIQKSYLAIEETGKDSLRKKFGKAGLVSNRNEIDGCNVFVGCYDEGLREKLKFRPISTHAVQWKAFWKYVGMEAPVGDIPSDCRAIVCFSDSKQGYHGRVEAVSIERYTESFGSILSVNWRTGFESNVTDKPDKGSFVVVVVPKTMDWTYSEECGMALINPSLITDHLNGAPIINTPNKSEKIGFFKGVKNLIDGYKK